MFSTSTCLSSLWVHMQTCMLPFPLDFFLSQEEISGRILAFSSWEPGNTKEGAERQPENPERERAPPKCLEANFSLTAGFLAVSPTLLPFKASLKKRCYPSRKEKKNELPLAFAQWSAPGCRAKAGRRHSLHNLMYIFGKVLHC